MTTARDIMHFGAECIKEDETLMKAAQMMRDLNVGSLPICGNDNRLHGIITDRDIVIRCVADGCDAAQMTAAELAQGRVFYVETDFDVDEVLAAMEEHQVKRVPVIENHKLVGMISEADLARHLPEEQLAAFVHNVYARS